MNASDHPRAAPQAPPSAPQPWTHDVLAILGALTARGRGARVHGRRRRTTRALVALIGLIGCAPTERELPPGLGVLLDEAFDARNIGWELASSLEQLGSPCRIHATWPFAEGYTTTGVTYGPCAMGCGTLSGTLL